MLHQPCGERNISKPGIDSEATRLATTILRIIYELFEGIVVYFLELHHRIAANECNGDK